jgi:hypothetical protein
LAVNGTDVIDVDALLGASEDGFVGFKLTAGSLFTSIELGGSGDQIFRMNNAYFSPVPEPSTIAGLATLGLFGLCITRRRRRNA